MSIDVSAATRGAAPVGAHNVLEPVGAVALGATSLAAAAAIAALVAAGAGLPALVATGLYGLFLVAAPRALHRATRGAPAARAIVRGLSRASGALAIAHVVFLGALGVAAFAVTSEGLEPARAAATVSAYASDAVVAVLVLVAAGVMFPGALVLMGRPGRARRGWLPLALVAAGVAAVAPALLDLLARVGPAEPVAPWVVATGLAAGVLSVVGAELFRRVFPRPFVAVDVASDGARAVAARRGGAWLVDLATGARVTALPDGQAAARFSPDGALLALDGGPGEVALRRARDGALVAVLAGAPDDVRALAFDAEAARLAAFSDAAEVVVWDVATGAARRYDAPLAYATSGAFTAAGDELVLTTAAGLTGRVALGDGAPRASRRLANGGASPAAARAIVADDGARLAWAHGRAPLTDHVAVHDLRGGSAPALRWSEGLPDAVRAARFDATGALVAAVSARSDVRVYEAANGAVLAARDGLGDAVGAVAVHGPSAQVVVGGRWSLRAWCWRTGEVRGLAGTDA